MKPRRRRVAIVRVEEVERRQLLSSVYGMSASQGNPAQTAVRLASLHAHNPASGTVAVAGTSTPTGGSALLGFGTPTAKELARERFRASFTGPALKGPGRFSDQAAIHYVRGVGTSNMFLHGDLNLAFVTPVDPTQPITGVAVLQDKNINNSAVIGLDLTADGSRLDRFGRPTAFSFVSDPNVYGGPYFITTSSGTGTIRYNGSRAFVTFSGLVYTSGLSNPLRNSFLLGNKMR